MKCHNCGGNLIVKKDDYEYESPFVGILHLNNFHRRTCESCDETLLDMYSCQRISQTTKKRTDELLGQLPIDDFINFREARTMLKLAPQTLIKKSRPYRLTFHIKRWGQRFFVRKSVEQYIKTGDGRYPLQTSKA